MSKGNSLKRLGKWRFWQWPASFIDTYPRHLAEAGKVDQAWADKVINDFHAAEKNPQAVMVTPMVLEVIAEKVGGGRRER